jgi:hypothetical protein
MQGMRERIEGLFASGTTVGGWIAGTHEILGCVATLLAIIWWIRLLRKQDKGKDE